jgi:hypothetical protein
VRQAGRGQQQRSAWTASPVWVFLKARADRKRGTCAAGLLTYNPLRTARKRCPIFIIFIPPAFMLPSWSSLDNRLMPIASRWCALLLEIVTVISAVTAGMEPCAVESGSLGARYQVAMGTGVPSLQVVHEQRSDSKDPCSGLPRERAPQSCVQSASCTSQFVAAFRWQLAAPTSTHERVVVRRAAPPPSITAPPESPPPKA